MPAAHNGLYGFKPTANRLGVAGMTAAMAGNEGLQATFGPITTDRETIDMFMKVVLDAEIWKQDPSLDNKLWQPVELKAPLKIAVMWDDGVVIPHPPVRRALQSVAADCRRAGMKVVDWKPLDYGKVWDLYVSLLYPDGGAQARAPLLEAGEPIMPLIDWISTEQPGCKERSIHEYWALVVQREGYKAKHAAHWNATGDEDGEEVDVILCPTGPGVASLHDTARYWSYTSIWNLLDYPAAIFPSGVVVDVKADPRDDGYVPVNGQDAYNHNLYDPEKFVGAPVGLQVVGRRGMDEKVMAAVAAIERAMGRTTT